MRRRIVDDLARIALIPLVCVGCWLAWKYSYYGDLLPRAFYLKAVNASSLERGFRYFYEFIVSYNLAPFLFFCIFFFGAVFRRENRVQLMMAATVTLWFFYVLKVGGDFMEFRFMAPVIPPMMILLVWLLFSCAVKTVAQDRRPAPGPRRELPPRGHLQLRLRDGDRTGRDAQRASVRAGGALGGDREGPRRCVPAFGRRGDRDDGGRGDSLLLGVAVGGYAGIERTAGGREEPGSRRGRRGHRMDGRSEDAWNRGDGVGGIDERSRGVLVSDIPGHQRVLTYEYLNARGVHLVLSHPIVTRVGDPAGALPLLPTAGPPHLNAR